MECPACWLPAALLCVTSPSKAKHPAGRCLPSFLPKSNFTDLLLLSSAAAVALELQPFSLKMASKACFTCFDHFLFLVVQKALEGEKSPWLIRSILVFHFPLWIAVVGCSNTASLQVCDIDPSTHPNCSTGGVIPCRIPLTIHGVYTVDMYAWVLQNALYGLTYRSWHLWGIIKKVTLLKIDVWIRSQGITLSIPVSLL